MTMMRWWPSLSLVLRWPLCFALLAVVGCQSSHEDRFTTAVKAVKAGEQTKIDMRDAPLTDAGVLRELEGATTLQQLTLDRSPVTDADLAAIGRLRGLGALSLTRTRVTDDGLATIAKNYPNLMYLRLDETTISDAGLVSLKSLSRLSELSLYRTPITSRGCKTLAEMPALLRVSLDQTMITDSGLVALEAKQDLERISIWQCQVSDEAVQRLKAALPNTEVNR